MKFPHVHNKLPEAPELPFDDDWVERLLKKIFDRTYTDRELPQDYYFRIADYLKRGVYEGFKKENLAQFVNTPDYDLIKELRENIYMFSAAKTYQQVVELSSLLTDGDRVRPMSEFLELGRDTFRLWNDDYAKTEYRTAVAQASMANKWSSIERNKDILPYLTYSSLETACDICTPLNGLTLPVDAPEWSSIYPPNHFNCMCLVTQEEDKDKVTDDDTREEKYEQVTEKMDNVFLMNSGKDRVIFSDDHPYFDVAPKDKSFARENFGLPIPPVSSELPGGTRKEQEARSLSLITDNLGLKPSKIIVDKELDLEIFTDMNNQLSDLFSEYEVSKVYNPKATPAIKFKSTSRYLGYISSSEEGTYLEEINFGSKVSKSRIDDSVILRPRSRVDEDKVHLSTLTHEFAHLITVDRQQMRYAKDERLKDFMPNLREIKARYLREIKELNKKSSRITKLAEVYLGDYASTNINEFMAEAFTEYKLCSKPSKYAVEVGKLIDKTFKRK